MKSESIEVNGARYNLKIYYEIRNDTTASIRNNNINIKIPIFLSRENQFKSLVEMRQWAIKKITENPRKIKVNKVYKNDEILKMGDNEYLLRIDFMKKSGSSAKINGNEIHLMISDSLTEEVKNKHISCLISKIIASKKLSQLKEEIDELNKKYFNKKINKIFFKNHKSKWGSCSSNNNINISTRLLFAPEPVMDYVCIHELAHLVEKNHSGKFWNLVEKAMPDYKDKIKWLRDNGDNCNF